MRLTSGLSRTRDIAADRAPADPTGQASIVVLPFANLSTDPQNEYFSDGIGEEITNALTRIDGLRVYRGTRRLDVLTGNSAVVDASEIAAALQELLRRMNVTGDRTLAGFR